MTAAAALATAVLGVAAMATSSGPWAAMAGLGAVITAALAWAGARPDAPVHVPMGDPEPRPAWPPAPSAEPVAEVEPPVTTGPAVTGGIVDEAVLATMLRGRLAMARRALRPLSLVYIEVDEVDGLPETEVAVGLRCTIREADVAGRRDDGLYVLVLDETGEDGAVWTAERLRRTLSADRPGRRFRAGVASYPSHGLDAADLEAKASEAIMVARQWHVDRIEVADPA